LSVGLTQQQAAVERVLARLFPGHFYGLSKLRLFSFPPVKGFVPNPGSLGSLFLV
jgi:hypothetical protein